MTSQRRFRSGERWIRQVGIGSIGRAGLDGTLPPVTKPGDPELGAGSYMTI